MFPHRRNNGKSNDLVDSLGFSDTGNGKERKRCVWGGGWEGDTAHRDTLCLLAVFNEKNPSDSASQTRLKAFQFLVSCKATQYPSQCSRL